MKHLMMRIYKHKIKLGNVNGMILRKINGKQKQYLFVDIDASATEATDQPEILRIPAAQYLYKKGGTKWYPPKIPFERRLIKFSIYFASCGAKFPMMK